MIRIPTAVLLAVWLVTAPARAAEIRLREVAEDWGLAFRQHYGGSGRRFMMETMGSGVVLFDFDNDGDEDVLFVDGGSLPGYQGEPAVTRLFRNEGDRRFREATERSGIVLRGYGFGGTAGDIEGDGDLDLYLTAYGLNQLWRNNGDGSFSDVTAAAGVGDERYSSSAAFADTDRDGDLDLYVVNYLEYTVETAKTCRDPGRGIEAYCHPTVYPGAHDRLYRNLGDGTFEDATVAVGLGDAAGNGLGLVFADLDNDGWPDLYIANDATPNFLFRNRGDGTFEDLSLVSGTAYGDRVVPEAGMGIAVGDVDGNGLQDLFVTNYALETNALYRNFGGGVFADARHVLGVAEPSITMLGFGVTFGDFDNDTDLDLVIANGHIQDNVAIIHPGLFFEQRNQLMINDGTGRFRDCPDCGLDIARVSRGLACADLDADGDLEVVINNVNDLAEVYENTTGSQAGGWLQVDLSGREGNRFGVDGRLLLTVGEQQLLREVRTGSSFLSQNALTRHFGLGSADSIGPLEVHWPGGKRQRFAEPVGNHRIRVYE